MAWPLAAKESQPIDTETADILYGLGRTEIATLQEPMDNLSRALDYYVEAGDVARAAAVA